MAWEPGAQVKSWTQGRLVCQEIGRGEFSFGGDQCCRWLDDSRWGPLFGQVGDEPGPQRHADAWMEAPPASLSGAVVPPRRCPSSRWPAQRLQRRPAHLQETGARPGSSRPQAKPWRRPRILTIPTDWPSPRGAAALRGEIRGARGAPAVPVQPSRSGQRQRPRPQGRRGVWPDQPGPGGSLPRASRISVHGIAPDGTLLGKVRGPKRMANLCFGSRLFLCASSALYALFPNSRGVPTP